MRKLEWVPKWLGEAYSKLWQSFGSRCFTPSEAKEILKTKDTRLHNILSRLYKAGYLVRFDRGILMAMSPDYVSASVAGRITLGMLRNRPHAPIVKSVLSCLFNHFGHRLSSASIFGSVARGDYLETSDIDLLIAVSDWHQNIVDRVKELVKAAHPVTKHTPKFWKKAGIYSPIQWYPLDSKEVHILRPLYLDMINDAVILYDKDNSLKKTFDRLKDLVREREIVKVTFSDSSYVWEAKSGEILTDVFSI